MDWVTPFQRETGCRVTLRLVEDMEQLGERFDRYRYDAVLAPPALADRLIEQRGVVPLNTDLVDRYDDLVERLRDLSGDDDHHYGVPYSWGVNTPLSDPAKVKQGGAGQVFAPPAALQGRIVMRDDPMTIADAALHLKTARRDLGIKDPYQLTSRQFEEAVELLTRQRDAVRLYWRQPAEVVEAFAGGAAVLGMATPYHYDVLKRAGRSVAVPPDPEVTGWADSWMISSRAENPNCAYRWLSWTTSPDVQRQMTRWSGLAPANPNACGQEPVRTSCAAYGMTVDGVDKRRLDRIAFAHRPSRDCRGAEGECTDYPTWADRWRQIVK
ncbi:extracellular solute-binding protein [Bailinhaonella thermotolerans]|uniref:Extracellular solute-binding protein n=1 Tax=Bailinhaonella thermotolerans TaxID=1070861 RepID=A0A3A4A2M3_9ACTN|nr:extracellular solute-binding protein [Bailinhaonella thermotolerans]